jgi:hypothetical protein
MHVEVFKINGLAASVAHRRPIFLRAGPRMILILLRGNEGLARHKGP